MLFSRPNLAFVHDVIVAALAFLLSLFLRLGDEILFYPQDQLLLATGIFTVVAAVAFRKMGMYRGVWRYASLDDLLNIAKASTFTILIFIVILFSVTRLEELPRSLPFICWFVLIALLGGPRFFYRLVKDRRLEFNLEKDTHLRIPVLLVGAGDGAELFIRDISRTVSSYKIVGILSSTESRVGRDIHGVRILGTTGDILEVVEKLKQKGIKPQRLIITTESLKNLNMPELFETTNNLGMTIARLPSLSDFKNDISEEVVLKPIDVEDLLGRPQNSLDKTAVRKMVSGKRLLISGAGGSIGGELARQLSCFEPAHISLLDNSEYNLFLIDLELRDSHQRLSSSVILADVRDSKRINDIIIQEKPEIIFHAAALKHVPMVEMNPLEGVATNILGTLNMANAARAGNVKTFVQISTDKAVNPTSVMGATKRVAEQYCQVLNMAHQKESDTTFVTVRFGNVLGSTGSVVELFRQQLANGGPLTVTDENMTRYFMTVQESVILVLQAAALGENRTKLDGKIFVLEMGEPVKIIDLARQMIKLAGLVPEEDIKITISGIRKGEKLFEEILHGSEEVVESDCEGVLVATHRTVSMEIISKKLEQLRLMVEQDDEVGALKLIRHLVPEYKGAD